MDGVKRALGGAQAAADALVGVDDRGTAAQAASGLGAHLLLGKGLDVLAKGRSLLALAVDTCHLAACVVIALNHNIVAVKRGVAALVAADGERGARLHKAMDGHGGLVTGGDGVDSKAGTGVDVAAHKDVGLGGLVRLRIGKGTLAAAELHLGASQQVAPHNGLANRHDHAVGIDAAQIVLVVLGRKPALVVKDTRAALKGDTAHTTGLVQVNLLGAPAAANVRAVLNGLATLLLAGRHLDLALQAEHLNMLGTQTAGVARDVDGHVAAAHHDGAPGQRVDLAAVDLAQKVDGHGHVLGILARNTGKAATLAANGHVKGFKALRAKLVERHIATDLHAIAELGAHQANDLDLGLDNVLLQLKARNAIGEHAARALVLLEHDGLVALLGQVESAGQAGRTGADDGDLLVEAAGTRRGHHRWDIASRGIQIALVVTFRDYQYSSDKNNADVNVPKLVPETVASTENTTEDPVGENLKKSTDEINAEIEKISDSLIAEFKQNMNNEGYQDIMIKHEVINTTDDYFTLKLMCYQAAGSGYEMDYYYTIDLKTGERLALKDLFKEGSDYITPISENIKSQMRGQMDADENVSYWLDDTEVPEWNFTSINDDTSFYINADGNLVISFNEGDVGPMSMGVVEFTIPHDVIADILK